MLYVLVGLSKGFHASNLPARTLDTVHQVLYHTDAGLATFYGSDTCGLGDLARLFILSLLRPVVLEHGYLTHYSSFPLRQFPYSEHGGNPEPRNEP